MRTPRRTVRRPALLLGLVLAAVAALSGCRVLTQVVAVDSGGATQCIVRSDGTVRCWGEPFLGDGAPEGSAFAVEVPGIDDAVDVAVGDGFACVLRAGGAGASCWGEGSRGQLGDGGQTDSLVPVPVNLGATMAGIAAAGDTACGRYAGGQVRCWGGRFGTTPLWISPVLIPGATGVTDIDVGAGSACAVQSTGGVRCWGRNDVGQLGIGTVSGTLVSSSQAVVGIADATAVTVGGQHACAQRGTGSVSCWGANVFGQLGDGSGGDASSPVTVAGLTDATSLDAGTYHTCATRADASVACWGRNASGAVDGQATGLPGVVPTPVSVPELTDVAALGLGDGVSCAARTNETVRCWGRNDLGQIGTGSTDTALAPTSPLTPEPLGSVTDAAVAPTFACAVSGATVKCWGNGSGGQLGDGQTGSSRTPVDVLALSSPTAVAAGASHACAIVAGGQVRCWGTNTSGQLGHDAPSSPMSATPVTVVGVTNAVSLDLGAEHSCAVLQDGSARCWGEGGAGQLGNGSTADRYSSVKVSIVDDATSISAGFSHTCATRATGAVWCWGTNDFGQLGDGTTDPRLVPVAAQVQGSASSVVTGASHTCAGGEAGVVECWGINGHGQLGDGVTAPVLVPKKVTALAPAAQLAAGDIHTCAQRGDGTLRCIGSNDLGQLGGPGGSGTVATPVGITTATGVTAGGRGTCAVVDPGQLRCFGDNNAGQLGDGTDVDRPVPTPVVLRR